MTWPCNFLLHPDSVVHQSESPDLRAVIEGISNQNTICAKQDQECAINIDSTDTQHLLVQSSGSTGAAKLVQREPLSWIRSFEITKETYGISPRDTYATFGSLGHSLTLYATLEALHLGADLCSLNTQGPQQQAQTIKAHNVNVLYATPTQLRLLLSRSNETFPEVRFVFSGGGKLDRDLRRALTKVFSNAKIIEFFGASETSFVTIANAETPEGSVGQCYPNVELRITDPDSSSVGMIWIKSPYLFTKYADGSSHDAVWCDGFLSIGEMGQLDEAGNLFLKGRANRMVTIADQNVFPEIIEQVIADHPAVDCCVVVAVPDTLRGTRLACFLTGQHIDIARLKRHCREYLKQSSVPKVFVVRGALPLLAAGKPDLQALQKIAKEHL